ncbi:protein ANTAGONIST OF LIKE HETEROCHROMATIN PROTEIN 1-like [Bidens hawaiensis]|uniref:protein ANTAGONIST OF LIKE HETEROCHROMATIN PROTEIN 1-like n=1 Tax=Bidens hawaiensis TaxID=980011 RepID=UPI004049CC0F
MVYIEICYTETGFDLVFIMDDNLFLAVRRHHLAVVHLVCLVVALIAHHTHRSRGEEMLHRRQVREEMLHELATGGKCRQIIRMSENAFMILCQKLESDGGFRSTQRMTIEEHVARFLHIIGNDFRNRFVSWFYYRSGTATSMHFHRVLNAIISLEDQYLIQPTGDTVQKQIQEKRRFYPFFKDCIGAIDGTHIRVKVPSKDAPRYRGRKGYPTINVLAACTFDLKFTYVLSGWEGTTSDSRVLKDALTREDKLNTSDGKFYLVDGGLPLKSTLIAPYRGFRYHLKEYLKRAPQNPRELFNLRHASLRNSIEREFGVLKRRFPIIRSTTEPFYSCETQSQIFLACCILHNYLLEVDRDRELEDEVAQEVLNATQDVEDLAPNAMDDRGEQIRESIANEMRSQYLSHPNNEINMSN